MTATVPVKRNGEVVILPARELVPGDIVFLRGGNVVPADCHWLEGDEMQVDTAALTGEPLPRKVPRPDKPNEEPGAGRELLSGCIIRQGEGFCKVRKTGLDTEIGAAAGLVQEASGHEAGVFETKIMQIVKCVIFVAIINAGVILYVQTGVRGNDKISSVLLAVLSIVIGAVPIALPLVMQVTMAIGAKTMAKEKAIVTHLTALQEIASMTVLCSDKTGTLTTAQMRVMPSQIWTMGSEQDDILMWAGVASNDANKEDPIDSSVLQSCEEYLPQQKKEEMSSYKKKKFVGFNPTTKRSIAYVEDPKRGNLKIAKGLISKVLSTGDDGGDCWEVADLASVKSKVEEQDVQFSTDGYKTIGVALSENDGPMKFEGILPMLDPPRHDTMLTIYRIREAGINVKMITGDHLNIAIETSKLIGLGHGILPATDLWPASEQRNEYSRFRWFCTGVAERQT
jgi:H+-transporting ATPase